MSDTPDPHLILHIKGTEQETTTLPRQVVRAAISQGQITHSQLIWSTVDNAWKQVRELPHLLPSQKLAPAPVRVPTGALPKVAAKPSVVPVPKAQTGPVPALRTPPQERLVLPPLPPHLRLAVPTAQPEKSYVVEEDDKGAHPLQWLCIGLGVLIVFLVTINYFLVDHSLVSKLGQTPYSQVTVYAHLGGYMQPSVVVIHVPKSTKLNGDNLADFMTALAKSTPTMPMSDNLFSRVP